MQMGNKLYDVLKYAVTIFAPALMTLVAGLGTIDVIANTDVVVTVIGLVATFVGALIGVSSYNYKKEEE